MAQEEADSKAEAMEAPALRENEREICLIGDISQTEPVKFQQASGWKP